jgi:hypothetical protein
MSLAEARSAREQAQGLLRDKIDPADKKRADLDELKPGWRSSFCSSSGKDAAR